MVHDRRRSLRAEKEDKSKGEQTFQLEHRMSSAFATMQQELERTAKETNAYADDVLALLGQLEGSHLGRRDALQNLKEYPSANKKKFDDLFSAYTSLSDELAPWRNRVIQAGEEAIQAQSVHMRNSCKDMIDAAKYHLDKGREHQQLAADASELMKLYKALLTTI